MDLEKNNVTVHNMHVTKLSLILPRKKFQSIYNHYI